MQSIDKPLGFLESILLWCAGAAPQHVVMCPQDERWKHQMIGASVIMTAVLAAVSGGVAAAMTLPSALPQTIGGFSLSPWGIPLGLSWSALVFSLDRFLVSSMTEQTQNLVKIVLPRALMACLIGLLVSGPAVVLVFHDSIATELQRRHDVALGQLRMDVKSSGIGDVEANATELDAVSEDLRECEREASLRLQRVMDEMDGVKGKSNGIAVYGDRAIRKNQEYSTQKAKCEEFRTAATNKQTSLNEGREIAEKEVKRRTEQLDNQYLQAGYPTRHAVLWDIAFGAWDFGLILNYVGVTLLLWLVEVIPILAKYQMLSSGQLEVYAVAVRADRTAKIEAINVALSERMAALKEISKVNETVASWRQDALDDKDSETARSAIQGATGAMRENALLAARRMSDALNAHYSIGQVPPPATLSESMPNTGPSTSARPTSTPPTSAPVVRRAHIALMIIAFAASAAMASFPGAMEWWQEALLVTGGLVGLFELYLKSRQVVLAIFGVNPS